MLGNPGVRCPGLMASKLFSPDNILIAYELTHYLQNNTTPDSYCRNEDIFTVGAAEVEGAPTVGVLGAQQSSRPYSWHCRGGW
jgi:hypothetical protein